MKYIHSPKIVIIGGTSMVGKTYIAELIHRDFGFEKISIDSIHQQMMKNFSIDTNHSEFLQDYILKFINILKELRYNNIVTEGTAFWDTNYVVNAFECAAHQMYGDYTIIKKFCLNPPINVRYKFYLHRSLDVVNDFIENRISRQKLDHSLAIGFYEPGSEPIPSEFVLAESSDEIYNWVKQNLNQKHPNLKKQHEEIVQFIAEGESKNPFYQTVEIDGENVLDGFHVSYKSWDDIERLGIDWQGKKIGEIGCMHGYFLFKAEDKGAIGGIGYDIDIKAINVANYLADKKKSTNIFEVHNINDGINKQFDIIFALNMLHYVEHIDKLLENLFSNCKEAVFEANTNEAEKVILIGTSKQFEIKQLLFSNVSKRFIIYLAKIQK